VSRRDFLRALAAALLAAAFPLRAQRPRKPRRIGYLVHSPLIDPPSSERAAFLDELRKLGYTVGTDLLIEYRSAQNEPDFLPDLAKELVALDVDLIVAGDLAANAAKDATTRIPIVITHHPDPVGSGLVRSLAKPGGNVTGNSFVSADLAGKRLQLLREALPSARKVALLHSVAHAGNLAAEVQASAAGAAALGLQLDPYAVESADALVRRFAQLGRDRPDAVLVLGDLKMVAYRDLLIENAARYRLPMVAGWPDIVRAGALLSYSPDFDALFRRSAHHVDRILKGARPGDMPVEQPTRFRLVVNLKSARALGVALPASVLVRADEVIR
jgi:putative ABC transport system substrate-binding protein